jgi:ATP-dependent Lhr-like helicase
LEKYGELSSRVESWFWQKGWSPFPFQHEVWRSYAEGKSGLIHASTGTGKTYAAWFAPLMEWMAEPTKTTPGITVLWITPVRALANDIEKALKLPVEDLGIPWRIESRTGDTSQSQKNRQKAKLPTVLITTPESLSLLLANPAARENFLSLKCVIMDEWHELLSSKRGVQAELCLARLRMWNPRLKAWGLSATIGNLETALSVLTGKAGDGVIIRGKEPKFISIKTIIPPEIEHFPWAGHLGIKLIDQVIEAIEKSSSCLLFTNTRSQTELWYQSILDKKPEWAGIMALHHGSLDREIREFVESQLKSGSLRLVIATSSLDLGVDFSPVGLVLQVGSPKGIARLLQRAGRSGHSPGEESRLYCVPTHAFELIEFAAAQDAVKQNKIESRVPIESPLDLLAQHLITIAIGGGFEAEAMYREIITSWSYRLLTMEQFEWVLDFITRGGDALRAYPEYSRVVVEEGMYKVTDRKTLRTHLMSIGTIASDSSVLVKFQNGNTIGIIEEAFVARMTKGDNFLFAGRILEFIRMKEMTAWVKLGKKKSGIVPRWQGGRMPLSSELAEMVREKLQEAKDNIYVSEEMQAIKPILEMQQRISKLPEKNELLIEILHSREGYHYFFYPFEGRLVHEGMVALFAYRVSQMQPLSFNLTCNDYGFELLSPQPVLLEAALELGLLSTDNLQENILDSMNASEMAKRQFREIARIAGLIFQGFPGRRQSNKQVQANSSLFYDVFKSYDPGNLLLHQAHREILDRQLEVNRLTICLQRLMEAKVTILELKRPSPLCFPIMVDRFRASLSSEQLAERVRKMQLVMD